MGTSVVDVKEDEPNDRSTPRQTRYWADVPREQQPGSNSSIEELLLLIYSGNFFR